MTETVRGLVARDIADATGLSDPDYGILSRLADLGGGRLRQHELAASMNWSKSRLSHQLSRMQSRGLVDRARSTDGAVDVTISGAGRDALADARPVHATAVRRYLLERLGPNQIPAVLDIARKLNPAALDDIAGNGQRLRKRNSPARRALG
jgi:DNA-binding MarR family transcriptional regulator